MTRPALPEAGSGSNAARQATAGRAPLPLADGDYERCRRLLYRLVGISLGPHKKPLVSGRLEKRLRAREMSDWGSYFSLLESGADPAELQTAVDLLTTNETYFFREPRHFDFLRERILPQCRQRPFRVWSAACSSGEEPYSIAMLLDDQLGAGSFEITASDISTRVLARAAAGHYPMARTDHMPKAYLRRYCLKGIGAQEGTLLVDPALRKTVNFRQVNLVEPLPRLPQFQVVFLRNVMIYFDDATREAVVQRLLQVLPTGGWLFVGHSENLRSLGEALEAVAPAVYRKR